MEKITIEFIEAKDENWTRDNEGRQIDNGRGVWTGWLVSVGDKYADGLTYDEMLGLITSLTLPVERPCLHWLRTREERERINQATNLIG